MCSNLSIISRGGWSTALDAHTDDTYTRYFLGCLRHTIFHVEAAP